MVDYIPYYGASAAHWGLLLATRLANRKILIKQNIKRQTGSALYYIYIYNILGAPSTTRNAQPVLADV
jgi:hypothetical protein